MMVVGLKSGKEFVVKDNSYILSNPEGRVYVFVSEDDKRMITINQADVEFFSEKKTQDRIKVLEEIAARTVKPDTSYNRDVI